MKRAMLFLLVALTFAAELVWSAAMRWPAAPATAVTAAPPSRNDDMARDPRLAWDRHDPVVDAIITSAVWTRPRPNLISAGRSNTL